MARIERKALLEKFRGMIAKRQPIIGGGAGTGLSAKCEEAGGIDLIVIYNSGRYRMAGRGSLAGLMAYGNANDIVQEMAREVLPVVQHTPVLAGVNGTDPFAIMDHLLDHLKAVNRVPLEDPSIVDLLVKREQRRTIIKIRHIKLRMAVVVRDGEWKDLDARYMACLCHQLLITRR